jgi:hypothetical protein
LDIAYTVIAACEPTHTRVPVLANGVSDVDQGVTKTLIVVRKRQIQGLHIIMENRI